MELKADMHMHTKRSHDSDMEPEDVLERSREAGLDVIGIADHNTTRGALETRRLSGGRPLVLIGQEIDTGEGEMVVFGPEADMDPGMGLLETARRAKRLGGFIIIPHPFDRFRSSAGGRMESILEYVDAVEVFNSSCLWNRFNERAMAFARERGLAFTVGSDAHIKEEIGKAIMAVDSGPTSKSVLDAIKQGETRIITARHGIKGYLGAYAKRLKNKLM